MNKSSPNLFYKILKEIKDNEVNSLRIIAKTLDITEELLKIIIQSLLEKGYEPADERSRQLLISKNIISDEKPI